MCCHSIEVGINSENRAGRLDVSASHTTMMNPKTAISEIEDPTEETTFHVV